MPFCRQLPSRPFRCVRRLSGGRSPKCKASAGAGASLARLMASPWKVWPGRPYPLGATWDGERRQLRDSFRRMPRRSSCACSIAPAITRRRGSCFRNIPTRSGTPTCRTPGRTCFTAIVFTGPYDPSNGHRFNPNKLLIDPYADALQGGLRWADAVFGYRRSAVRARTCRSTGATIRAISRSAGWSSQLSPGIKDRRPRTPWEESIVIELHVRGITVKHPDVEPSHRGTFAGLVSPAMIDYLVSLGITAVELLPIAARIDDRHLA